MSLPSAVQPGRVPIRNVWHLLLHSWEHARLGEWTHLSSEDAPDLLFPAAELLAELGHRLVRVGLRRDYLERDEELRRIRGRIDFAASVRSRAAHRQSLWCRHDELDADVLPNRILRGTAEALLRRLRRPQWTGKPGVSQVVGTLRDLDDRLAGIRPLAPEVRHFGLLPRTRSGGLQSQVLSLCRLLCELRLLEEASGETSARRLLRDEMRMEDLFESFVRCFLRRRLEGAEVKREYLRWPVGDDPNGLLPIMKTDVSVRWPDRMLIIEVKYSGRTLGEHHGARRLRSSHLYQLFAYLRSQEDRKDRPRDVAGLLLYPTVDDELDSVWQVQGHALRVATVDLMRPWEEIEERVLRLGGWNPHSS